MVRKRFAELPEKGELRCEKMCQGLGVSTLSLKCTPFIGICEKWRQRFEGFGVGVRGGEAQLALVNGFVKDY